jgi:hypothetical protein
VCGFYAIFAGEQDEEEEEEKKFVFQLPYRMDLIQVITT